MKNKNFREEERAKPWEVEFDVEYSHYKKLIHKHDNGAKKRNNFKKISSKKRKGGKKRKKTFGKRSQNSSWHLLHFVTESSGCHSFPRDWGKLGKKPIHSITLSLAYLERINISLSVGHGSWL